MISGVVLKRDFGVKISRYIWRGRQAEYFFQGAVFARLLLSRRHGEWLAAKRAGGTLNVLRYGRITRPSNLLDGTPAVMAPKRQ